MFEEYQREFKGIWIPKEIWLNKELSLLEKALFAEIWSLDREDSGCTATNKYFSEFMGCTETSISTAISKLKKLEYVEQISFNGRIRILKICLKNFVRQPLKNLKADFKKFNTDKIIDNNINNNLLPNKLDNNLLFEKNSKKEILEKEPKKLFVSKKPKKKDLVKIEFKEEFKKYFLDEDILDKLNLWLEGQYEKNKLPTKAGLILSLQQLSKFKKQEILDAIENSIKSCYITFYIKSKNEITKDGINMNATTSIEKLDKTKEFIDNNFSKVDKIARESY